jgi:hypothetical protein
LRLQGERDRLRDELDQSQHWRRNYADAVKDATRERDAALAEVDRLRDLIPQAWSAGMDRAIGAEVDFEQTYPSIEEWMQQKGLS